MSSFEQKFEHLKVPLRDILIATNDFAGENLIGRGGLGEIYRGQLLSSGELIDIAARRLGRGLSLGIKEFQTEIKMLSSLKHQNLVTFVGFCDEYKEKIIINRFEAKKSLDQHLSDPVALTWTRRLRICLDIARALRYIHYDKQRSFNVIHRDVKSSKILLGDMWEAKLSGFGLSTMQPASRRHGLVLDDPRGTMGYVDPAYIRSGGVTHKSDVYSFGVVLFEVLSGRKAVIRDNNGVSILSDLVNSYYENGTLSDIIHPGLHNQMDSQSLKRFTEAAYGCLNNQRAQRPNIDRVFFALEQALKLQQAYEKSVEKRNDWERNDLEHLKIEFDAIKLATENFAEKYRIGSGGYGVVYKAELEHFDSFAVKDNKESELHRKCSNVAIKYISNREDREGEQGFIVEIETLSSCTHPNIVSLRGFCNEPPHMILVYEHVSNGSLDDYLGSEGKMTIFTWIQRIKICIDIVHGLDYIHTIMDNKPKIIHRDIKSANILLGDNWEAKIADFGLSKFHPLDHMASTINATNVAGTQVYLDPEYDRTGKLKKESDVYSFGVVLFEIMSGTLAYDRRYTNENEKGLAPIVRQRFEDGTLIKEMLDPDLREESTFTLSKGPNQDSLNTFLQIGYKCLAEKQVERPKMKVVIEELMKALNFQETHKDDLRISLEDIRLATEDFNNQIGCGGFGKVYIGEILRANGPTPIAVKRWDNVGGQGEKDFLTEREILFEYKHENIIGLVGYCNEDKEKILVYEYASNGSLDKHLKDASVTWTQRLEVAIDVAVGLDFLHEGDSPVIHRDIKSSNILLSGDWKAKITDFGWSVIIPVNNEFDFVVDDARGTFGYVDPQYFRWGFLTRESDMYSLGVVLFEILCGRMVYLQEHEGESRHLITLVKRHYEEGNVEELVFEAIKNKIMPKSLTTYQRIAYECLHGEREKRPTASEVVLQLKKALEFQKDIEIWEAKLPRDYKEIIQMSKNPEFYSNLSKKDLYHIFSKGILLQQSKVCLSVDSNGERNEMISATTFSYENNRLHKRRSVTKSGFHRVLRITDISNLKTQIKIKTQFLSPNVIYGAYLIFKFYDPRKFSNQPMYVNLKYKLGSETLHAYFATWRDDEWLMIELCRLLPSKKDVDFEVQLESMSRCYCGSGAICVEGIHFRAITNATLKLSEVNGKKCNMLPAKMVLYDSSNVKCFKWKRLAESNKDGFIEVAEFLSHQVFQIKCKIETQKLSSDTNYACHLIFELSQKCHGLHCPVKVQDVLLRKSKESKFLYFRSPRFMHLQGNGRVPKHREDGLMEVIVWEFNSGNKPPSDDHLPMSLKLRCYEGNLSGLIVYGIEFRPM